MIRYAMLAVATVGCAALTVGCQNSGHTHAEAEYHDRPQTASTYTRTDTSTANTAGYTAGATIDTSAYTTALTVKRDTSFMASPTSTSSAGSLHQGETVYLRSGTTLDSTQNNGYVAVRTTDDRVVYVRADDLSMR